MKIPNPPAIPEPEPAAACVETGHWSDCPMSTWGWRGCRAWVVDGNVITIWGPADPLTGLPAPVLPPGLEVTYSDDRQSLRVVYTTGDTVNGWGLSLLRVHVDTDIVGAPQEYVSVVPSDMESPKEGER